MPITRPNMNLYSINNLALDYDPGRGRYGLSLECPRADAFTLCLGKNLPLADPEKLGLTEEELRRLHNGHSMDKGGYRLIGVTQGTFYAMPVFRGFEADPPQTIQVWSMMAVPGGIVHLYYTPGREAVWREFLSCFSLIFRAFPAFCFSVIRCADHKKPPFFIQR